MSGRPVRSSVLVIHLVEAGLTGKPVGCEPQLDRDRAAVAAVSICIGPEERGSVAPCAFVVMNFTPFLFTFMSRMYSFTWRF